MSTTTSTASLVASLQQHPVTVSTFAHIVSKKTFSDAEADAIITALLKLMQNDDEASIYAIDTLSKIVYTSPNIKVLLKKKHPQTSVKLCNWSFLLLHRDAQVRGNALEFLYWLITEVEGDFSKYTAFVVDAKAQAVLQEYFTSVVKKMKPDLAPQQAQQFLLEGEALLCSLPKIASLPNNAASLKPKEEEFTKKDKVLAWIDDNPQNNKLEIGKAQQAGVKVFTFTTNYSAKVWLFNNEDTLKEMGVNLFRIVTDRHRDAQSVKEDKMGGDKPSQTFRDYIRDKLKWSTPIMIYCGNPTTVKHLHSVQDRTFVNTDRPKCITFVTMGDLSKI